MRTRQLICILILAFLPLSCQTFKSPGKAPVSAPSSPASPEFTRTSPSAESPIETKTAPSAATPPEAKPAGAPGEPGRAVAGQTLKEAVKTALPKFAGSMETGLITPPGQTPETAARLDKEKQKVVLNFDKADLGEVTSQIFGDYLKVNYVIDPTVQGRISLYIEGEYTNDELLQMVMRAYEANNVAVVLKKGVFYIQPIARSKAGSLPFASQMMLQTGKEGGRPVIVLYRMRYLDAGKAKDLARFFLAPGREIVTEPVTNTIIFIEDADNAQTVVSLLKTIDINVLKEVSMEIVPLRSMAPQDAVQSMDSLVSKLGMFKDTALKSNLAFIPLQNFGGVLVLAQSAELLKTAKEWLLALDIQGAGTGEQIYVYFVQNGLAHDIADILNAVYGIGGGGGGRLQQQVVPATGRGVSGTSRSSSGGGGGFGGSSGGFGGSSGGVFGGSSSRSSFGSTAGTSTGASTGTSAGTTATTAGTSRTGGGTIGGRAGGAGGAGGQKTPSMFTGEVALIADEVNNAIVIRSNAVDYAKIKNTIDALDILPRAVLIQVVIAEVDLSRDLTYGIQWYMQHEGFKTSFGGISPVTSTVGTSTVTGFPDVGALSGAGIATGWIGLGKDVATFLSALSQKTNLHILSTPTLVATDNKEATITVGGRQPVPTGSYTGGTEATGILSTIDYEETGILLTVTPHINAGGLVRLEVELTTRDVSATTTVGSGSTAPVFDERNLKTTLLSQNGNTAIIGGIIQNKTNITKKGVPGLSDIPIFSPLFSAKTKKQERDELIVAITPHVIDHRGGDASREFIERLKRLKQQLQQ